MNRALLLVNPHATRYSPRLRDVIARALSSELKLDVVETKRRDHATHIATGAAHEGVDMVVVLGGDGTLNEVINGLRGSDVVVAPLPGGGTNVFSRTLGFPNDPIEATGELLERLDEGQRSRRIDLGSVNGRAFAFCAGIGFDAAVVRSVEKRAHMKRNIGQAYFVYQAVKTYFFGYPRRSSSITITIDEEVIRSQGEVIACNSDPYTFWGSRPLRLLPGAGHSGGLDLLTLSRFRSPTVLRTAWHGFRSGKHLRMRNVIARHSLRAFRVECEHPTAYQVDGDFAGEGTTFEFESLPRALSVLS